MSQLTNCMESGQQQTPITSFVQRAKKIEAAAAFYNMFLACRCKLMNQTEAAKDVKFRLTSLTSQSKLAKAKPPSKKQMMLDVLAGNSAGGHSG